MNPKTIVFDSLGWKTPKKETPTEVFKRALREANGIRDLSDLDI